MSNPSASFPFAMNPRSPASAAVPSALEDAFALGETQPESQDDLSLGVEPAVLACFDAVDGQRRNASAARELGLAQQLRFPQLLQIVSSFAQRHGPPEVRRTGDVSILASVRAASQETDRQRLSVP